MELLLCIDDSQSRGITKGKVYTLADHLHCPCGMADAVTLLEHPLLRRPRKVACKHCGKTEMTSRPLFASARFIPLNKPGATDEKEVNELFTPNQVVTV